MTSGPLGSIMAADEGNKMQAGCRMEMHCLQQIARLNVHTSVNHAA